MAKFAEILKQATEDSRDICEMRKTSKTLEKKGMHEITWKLSTDVSRFDYFVVQLFDTFSHEKITSSPA